MKMFRCFIAVAVLWTISGPLAGAQSQQAAPSPAAAPEVLVLVHQQFQFGKEGARQKIEAAISRACDQIDVPNLWIDLQSITGEPESLSFDPMDSFAQVDDAFAAWGQIYASHPELARMQEQIRAMETGERTIIAVRRDDVSYQPGSIDLSKARFMRVLEVRVRPGHEDQFVAAFKTLRAAYASINADLPWVVYQINAGMQTPTFLAFVPMRELKQNDDLLTWRPLLHEAEGETGTNEMQQIASDSYIATESNLYAISPETSHVSKEFAAGDPEFWTPRSAASVKPTADQPVKANNKKTKSERDQ
ncbi:MAG TPA: hypothetical protein VE077_05540 [Candidatus Methylomirabilis sp.]|nr:hypothetical protein [Candidatus Methylomirabilis sp.]